MSSFLPRHWFLDILSKDSILSLDKDSISIKIKDLFIVVANDSLSFHFSKPCHVTVMIQSIFALYDRNHLPSQVDMSDSYALINGSHHENLTPEAAMEKLISLSNGVIIPTLVDGKLSITDNQARFRAQMGLVTVLGDESHELTVGKSIRGDFTTPDGSKYTYELDVDARFPNFHVTESRPSDEWSVVYSFNYLSRCDIQSIKLQHQQDPHRVITVNRKKSQFLMNNGNLLPESVTKLIENADTPSKMNMAVIHVLGVATA